MTDLIASILYSFTVKTSMPKKKLYIANNNNMIYGINPIKKHNFHLFFLIVLPPLNALVFILLYQKTSIKRIMYIKII